jgi:hypothetical protein
MKYVVLAPDTLVKPSISAGRFSWTHVINDSGPTYRLG